MNKKRKDNITGRIIADNKKARFNYDILEEFEAGLVLTGAEIKSIRQGNISLKESFIAPEGRELFLKQAYIKQYSHSNDFFYDPLRKRKLLLHKREINKLIGKVETKGLTIVPLAVFINNRGYAKLKIALAKGRKSFDKRAVIKEREANREAQRALKYHKS